MSPRVDHVQRSVLALVGRGELPFALLHGSPLYVHAVRALAEVGSRDISVVADQRHLEDVRRQVARVAPRARVVDEAVWWREVSADPGSLLVHDPLCPLASAEFLGSVAEEAERERVTMVAIRPVTDTVKTVVDDRIQGTIDRESLAGLIAPLVVTGSVVEAAVAADDPPPLADFGELVTWLRARGRVVLVKGPSLARRVDDTSAVNLLECVDELSRRVRTEPRPQSRSVSDA